MAVGRRDGDAERASPTGESLWERDQGVSSLRAVTKNGPYGFAGNLRLERPTAPTVGVSPNSLQSATRMQRWTTNCRDWPQGD